MTVFDERFTNHAVFDTLTNLRTQLREAEDHLSTPELEEAHARLVQVADYVDRVLESAEPALTPLGPLNNLNSSLQKTTNLVQQFIQNKQADRLVNQANSHIDNALAQARSIYVPVIPEEVEGLRKDLVKFRRSAGQHLRRTKDAFKEARSALTKQLQESQKKIEQTAQQIETKLNEVEQAREGLVTARDQFQSQFSKAQDRRSTEFSKAVDERTQKLQELVTESQKELDNQLSGLVTKADAYIDQLEERKAEVEKVVGAIGADALSGGFNKTAASEGTSADRWRRGGVVFFVLAIAAAALLFGPLHEATELAQIGAKAVIVVPLIGLGTYAFKESGRHRRVQWRNRRLALELASIDPYLALFEESERNAVKKDLVERWFAQQNAPFRKEFDDDDAYSPSALVALAEKALGLLGKRL